MLAKASPDDLALFGGAPAFAEPLHVGRPNIGDRERLFERINELLDRRWLSNHGRFVQQLEQTIAERLGVAHCVAMCNATVALEITARALNLTGEVIVPSFTFIATAHALQWQEITPVFCDIHPDTHTIDPSRVEELVTPRTSGIIGVHVWGNVCDVAALEGIAAAHNLQLAFDASHAFDCSSGGQMIGNFGRAEIFSFHATKFFNTFEGGAVVTNDGDLAEKIRLMKNFGFAGLDEVIYIGTNGKMSEASAAMGLTSLESLDEFVATNRQNFGAYRSGLSGIPGITLRTYDERERCNYQYVVLEVDEDEAGLSRDQLIEILWAENVIARRYFYPGCHRMEPYRSYYPHAHLLLPQTERVAQRVLLLPTGTAVSIDNVATICDILGSVVGDAAGVRRRLVHGPAPSPANQRAAIVDEA